MGIARRGRESRVLNGEVYGTRHTIYLESGNIYNNIQRITTNRKKTFCI